MVNRFTSEAETRRRVLSWTLKPMDWCASFLSIAMVFLALVVVVVHGLNGFDRVQASSLDVRSFNSEKAGVDPDSFVYVNLGTENSILPSTISSWIRIDGLNDDVNNRGGTLLLPTLQLTEGRLWLYQLLPSGLAIRRNVQPILFENSHLGATALIPPLEGNAPVIGIAKVVPKMPKIVSARQVTSEYLKVNKTYFERYGGALAGMFMSLAAFAFVIGAMNREGVFLLFSGWLVTTYRLAAVSVGYDLEWIVGIDPASTLGQFALRATYAVHGLLAATLFKRLFEQNVHRYVWILLGTVQVAFFCLAVISPFVPHIEFFQLAWALSAFGLVLQIVGLANAAIGRNRGQVVLPTLAWSINILGSLLQIAIASGWVTRELPFVNARTAAFASGFLIAIALADRMRTERRARLKAQRNALEAMARFQQTYKTVPIGLFSLDEGDCFVQFNPSFSELLIDDQQHNQDAWKWSDFFAQADLKKLRVALLDRGKAEVEVQTTDGFRWFRIHAYNSERLIEGSIEDISVRRKARETLQRQTEHDSLTDLLNRRGLDSALSDQLSSFVGGTPSCLAFMDMDRFKLVNDMFGHAAGDSVLLEIANRLRKSTSENAVLARVGGDEFVLLFKGCSSEEARSICICILAEVNRLPYSVGEKQFSVLASIGLIALTSSMTPSFAVSAADRACADAKRQGGDRVVVYGEADREMRNHIDEMNMVSKIHSNLPVDRMRMVLQPIVSLQAPFSSLSYESLLRVVDDSGRLGPPAALIQAAERHGFVSRLDRWVLNTMVDWLNANPAHRERLNYCAINLSGASLNDERFLADVLAIVRANPEAARRMCFEITETVALYDLKNTCRFVDSVRGYGSKVALDDFGAGYTSFNYLKSLQADLVKIDGTFVKTLDTDRSNYAITRTIVDLTHEMGMSCVAEWAENARVVEMLAEMGVDYGQGWALAKPLEMADLLSVQNSGELVTNLEVMNILQKDREPAIRMPRRAILQGEVSFGRGPV